MEGHGGTHPFTYPILSASDGGWTDPGKQDCFAYPHDFQTSEVGFLASRGSPTLY